MHFLIQRKDWKKKKLQQNVEKLANIGNVMSACHPAWWWWWWWETFKNIIKCTTASNKNRAAEGISK